RAFMPPMSPAARRPGRTADFRRTARRRRGFARGDDRRGAKRGCEDCTLCSASRTPGQRVNLRSPTGDGRREQRNGMASKGPLAGDGGIRAASRGTPRDGAGGACVLLLGAPAAIGRGVAAQRPAAGRLCSSGTYVVKGRSLIRSAVPKGEDAVVLSMPGETEGAAPAVVVQSGCPEAPITLEAT